MDKSGVVKPVLAEELRFAMAIFENAALMKTPRTNVQPPEAMIINEDGSPILFRLPDHKLTRGLTAVIEHYQEQKASHEDRHAIAWRILYIPDLAKCPSCAKWLRETPKTLEFEDAVIETLATYPMRYDEDIDIEDFFRQVEVIANRKAA